MSDVTSEATTYPCPVCVGTGSMESSDSTDDRWWDCRHCNGTGRLAERRRPASVLREALERIARGRHDGGAPMSADQMRMYATRALKLASDERKS